MQLAGNAFNGSVVAACLIALMTVTPWDGLNDGCSADASDGEHIVDSDAAESIADDSEVESCPTPVTD